MQKLQAYETFKARLLSGQLKPGQFITQRELAHLAGVPLGATREAIQRLEQECLLKVYPQRGIQVADATVAALGDAFEYREIIEAHAVRQFALHASKAVIETLERATQEVLSKASGEISRTLQEKAVEVDWRMHDQIVDSLGNQPVSRDYRVNSARIRLMRASNRLIPERLVSAMNEHLAILRACKKRDPEAAAASLRIHLAVARQRALDHR